MPYARRSRRRYGRFKKRRVYRGRRRVSGNRRIKRVVKRMVETKFVDFDSGALGILASGSYVTLHALPTAGTGDSNRIGDKVEFQSIELRGELSTGNSSNLVRLSVIIWDMDVGAPSALSQIYSDPSDFLRSPFQEHNTTGPDSIFKVLYDHVYFLQSAQPNMTRILKWKFFGKRLPHKVQYLETGGTLPQRRIYIVMTSDSTVPNGPAFHFGSRLKFKDM